MNKPLAKPTPADLMADVSTYLAARRDIQILATGEGTVGPRIVGVHLRRLWFKKTYTAAIFTPHEREMWHYYGQAFVVEEAEFTDSGDLCDKQKELRAGLQRAGTEVILAKTLEFVKGVLGLEPENWGDYEKRLEK